MMGQAEVIQALQDGPLTTQQIIGRVGGSARTVANSITSAHKAGYITKCGGNRLTYLWGLA